MANIDFSIDETDPDVTAACGNFSVLKAHRTLQEYLEACEDTPGALLCTVARIDLMLSPHNKESREKEAKAEYEHRMFYQKLLDLVCKIPYSHPAQAHLVSLLGQLSKSRSLNSHKECFVFSYHPDSQTEEAYIRQCAFMARLSSAGIIQGFHTSLRNLRTSLEFDWSKDDHHNMRVAGSTMWILFAGQFLFQNMVHSRACVDEVSLELGELYTGPVMGLDRWCFWRKAFDSARECTQFSDDTKALVGKTIDLMDAIERANT
ncbi:uncharacterized protein N7483_011731 [Penicillium malachiteum]|uniref:uncharacterized protein n=1 Tax=Penicillium malachiteum TaxID=1324776 RepID=UPI00254683C5|nr:uncharacterized protein N7483_011731 [Penicillium malachiteum]KAJ5714550.1 hypothetical protein N7483_011731 [Penicillium malachiteum]